MQLFSDIVILNEVKNLGVVRGAPGLTQMLRFRSA